METRAPNQCELNALRQRFTVALRDVSSERYVLLTSADDGAGLRLVDDEAELVLALSEHPAMPGPDRRPREVVVNGYADLSALLGPARVEHAIPRPPAATPPGSADRAARDTSPAMAETVEPQWLSTVMNSLSEGIFFKDSTLRYRRVNAAYAEHFRGLLGQDVVGKTLSELRPNDAATLATEAEERELLEGKRSGLRTLVELEVEGRRHLFAIDRTPIRGVDGATTGLVGVARDVTEVSQMGPALDSDGRLHLLFGAVNAGVLDWNLQSGTVTVSPTIRRLLGVGSAQPLSEWATLTSRVHPEDATGLRESIERHTLAHSILSDAEFRLRTGAGGYCWFHFSSQAVFAEDGTPIRIVGALYDVSDRRARDERHARMLRVRAMLGSINSTIVRVTSRRAIVRASCEIAIQEGRFALAFFVGVAGLARPTLVASAAPSEAVLERAVEEISIARLLDDAAAAAGLAAGEPLIVAGSHALADGAIGKVFSKQGYAAVALLPIVIADELDGVFLLASNDEHAFEAPEIALLRELTGNVSLGLDRLAKTERLAFVAHYDPLTQLPKREVLCELINQRFAACEEEQRSLAIAVLDIGRFRQLNETLGRAGGDALLVQVAQRLKRDLDVAGAVARLEGNVFVLVSPPLEGEAEAIEFVNRSAFGPLSIPFEVGARELRLSAKVGIAVYPANGVTADTLLSKAETALKAAKSSGRRQLFYEKRMDARVEEKVLLETKLRRAIERQEFLLHYQPKVELKTGTIVGLEGLIRWNDPDGGLVPPGAFIPVLEETGMIIEVGTWVLEEAAAQYCGWLARGMVPPRIAVNVSALQLTDPGLLDSAARVVERFPDARDGIELEITESVVMQDLFDNIKKLQQLKDLGFTVAVDDFGTGYSSLGYLSRLPIDALKIDRSFVNRMAHDPQDMTIVTTIISLAHSLELKVIAEGVETTNQAQLLRLLRCDQIQGYLVSKPLRAEDIVHVLTATYRFDPPTMIG